MLTQDNGVLSRQLIGKVTCAKYAKPCTEFKDGYEPAFSSWIRYGCAHPVVEVFHTGGMWISVAKPRSRQLNSPQDTREDSLRVTLRHSCLKSKSENLTWLYPCDVDHY